MFGIVNESNSAVGLLKDLGLGEEQLTANLKALAAADARYLRDLKINVSNVLAAASLTRKEAYLLALAVAANEKNTVLQGAFEQFAVKEGATDKEVAEVLSCMSLLN